MYICLQCGEIFDKPEYEIEQHYVPGNPDMSGAEYFTVCPRCGEGYFEKAEECEECGEIFPKYKIDDGLCPICLKNLEKKETEKDDKRKV